MADEDDVKEYRWESGYEKTWEAIKEDDEGNLEASVAEIIQKAKRKAQLERRGHTRLGIMRHVYVIVDGSEAMLDQDLKPTRQMCTLKLLTTFIEEFLYENPLSQIGLIISRNKRAEKISDLSGSSRKHTEALQSSFSQPLNCTGEPSLQNALELSLSSLKNMPSHASREVIVIMGSLTTCDPGDIYSTIESLKSHNIRVSVIGIGAEVRLCTVLCKTTGGVYNVLLDDVHFKHLLCEHVLPPPAAPTTSDSALIKMGFPHHTPADDKSKSSLAMCMCHLDSKESKLESGGYLCPQCRSKYCELPIECRVCGLTLVSAPHLARSYHHLFPVPAFIEVPIEQCDTEFCFACHLKFKPLDKNVYRCGTCQKIFCLDCDMFAHDTLHMCPGCAINQNTFQRMLETT